jgi:hypothetical protein
MFQNRAPALLGGGPQIAAVLAGSIHPPPEFDR